MHTSMMHSVDTSGEPRELSQVSVKNQGTREVLISMDTLGDLRGYHWSLLTYQGN